jgi:hypothetical protein
MAASDYVPIFFKNRLHLAGRPQMSTRPSAKSLQIAPRCHSKYLFVCASHQKSLRLFGNTL